MTFIIKYYLFFQREKESKMFFASFKMTFEYNIFNSRKRSLSGLILKKMHDLKVSINITNLRKLRAIHAVILKQNILSYL